MLEGKLPYQETQTYCSTLKKQVYQHNGYPF